MSLSENYNKFVKKLELPDDFHMPAHLAYEDLVARPLSREDLNADLEGVNSSISIIQQTRGGSWPSEELEKDADFLDLAWHEREFRDASSFAYVVYDNYGQYIGCFYLYGIGHRTIFTAEVAVYDVDASWWVTQSAYSNGYYDKLYAAIMMWLADSTPFKNPYFSNKVIPE